MSKEDTTATEAKTEEAITSTNEEALDTEADDVSLEDDTTSFDDVEDDETEETEDSEDEKEDTEPAESEEKSEEDDGETEEEPETPTEAKEEDTTSEEAKRQYNAEMARRRIAERQAREATQALENQNLQRYLDEAGEDELELGRRQLEVKAYQLQAERAQVNADMLESGIARAVADIKLFHSGTPEVQAELARRLEDFEAKHVQYDRAGRPVKLTGNVYEYLKTEADSLERIMGAGALQQTKAKAKAQARTATVPSRAPKEAPKDPDLAAFDEEVKKWE